MSAPIVLSLCDLTGNMVRPWREAGFECWIVDLQHPAGEQHIDDDHMGRLVRVGADITDWLPPRRDYVACFAFPPCTDLAVSGARWTCLWTGGGFVMPEREPLQPELGSKMHLLPPSPDRANLRSATPNGFARAVLLANHPATRAA